MRLLRAKAMMVVRKVVMVFLARRRRRGRGRQVVMMYNKMRVERARNSSRSSTRMLRGQGWQHPALLV